MFHRHHVVRPEKKVDLDSEASVYVSYVTKKEEDFNVFIGANE